MFKVHFRMMKDPSRKIGGLEKGNTYGWEDTQYSTFMIAMLQSLEPRFYSKGEYIFEEQDEVVE